MTERNLAIDESITFYSEIFGSLFQSTEFGRISSEISSGRPAVVVSGLAGSARALILTALEKKLGRRVVFVARSNRDVEEFLSDVDFFYCALNGTDTSDRSVLAIPAVEADPYDGTSPHAEVLEQRALALYRASK